MANNGYIPQTEYVTLQANITVNACPTQCSITPGSIVYMPTAGVGNWPTLYDNHYICQLNESTRTTFYDIGPDGNGMQIGQDQAEVLFQNYIPYWFINWTSDTGCGPPVVVDPPLPEDPTVIPPEALKTRCTPKLQNTLNLFRI